MDDPRTATTLSPGEGATTASGPPPADGFVRRGDRLDRWILREKLGEGGFAEVYVAEETGALRRRVAIKIVKAGMDTKQLIARFEAERQALALMDHPNVAKVFDTGTTPAGRHYFVMEYVAGESIGVYCNRHRLSIEDRLLLFGQACDAVQHAHQKGIIHRDLKPSNVLVSVRETQATVKVIDFGVAKAIGPRLTDKTIHTEFGQLIGTPEYMSPEQAEMTGLDVDTRCDIYALGVLLYELLTGTLPFDSKTLRSGSPAEIQRVIREVEPDMPSVRLDGLPAARRRDLAGRRSTDIKGLLRTMRGDLDWITMKAMDKDRTRRYPSASELRADVSRHLRCVPVLATPPSVRYWLNKFVRRHTIGAAATSCLVFALLAAVVVSTAAAIHQARQRARAIETITYLTTTTADPGHVVDPERALVSVISTLRKFDRDHPMLIMSTRSLAALYAKTDRHEKAAYLLDEAIEHARRTHGDDGVATGELWADYAAILETLGRTDDAVEANEQAMMILGSGPREPPTPTMTPSE